MVGIGEEFVLECAWELSEGATPELSVAWITTPQLNSSRTSFSGEFDEILHVSDSKQSDSGTYVCTVGGSMINPVNSSAASILVEGMCPCVCVSSVGCVCVSSVVCVCM